MIRRLMALSIVSFAWLILFLAGNQQITAISTCDHDVCAEQKCSPDGPAITFPFVLQGKQPQCCGYNSSFNLRCDGLKRTILELPTSSIKFQVTNISYSTHTMELQSLETCLAKHSRDLDISTTPFWYPTLDYYENGSYYYYEVDQYSLFNCSPSLRVAGYAGFNKISCLGHNEYNVYAICGCLSVSYLIGFLKSCTKMYDTKLVPSKMFQIDSIKLHWSLPQCGRCEAQGEICRRQNGSSSQIGCNGINKHHSGMLKKVLLISGPIIGCFFIMLATSVLYLAYSTKKLDREDKLRLKKFLEDYAALKPTRYSYADIKKITNDFKDKLGEGGYGNVFKGKVSNNIFVAVKLLHSSTENGEEFINEVGTMGKIHHVNVVRLLGFCADGYKKALVYEFLSNGSLDKFIFPDGQEHHTLGTKSLLDIAIGIGRGIEYLHQGCEQRILHFDIKPHNILLDENYNPKISDFGLAKLCEKGRSAVSMTDARGTMGYIAPEVFSRQFGNVSYKSDIYSFGMLLLEMVGKRKNTDTNVQNVSQVYFPEWIYGHLIKEEEEEEEEEYRIQVVDDEEDGEEQIAKKLAIVGLWCIQWNPANRPSITYVLQMLEGIAKNLTLPPNPFASGPAVTSSDQIIEHTRLPFNSTLAVISESN